MAVAALTKLGKGNIDTKTGKSVLKRLWNAILQVIESLTGISVKNLKPTATLQDLADLLTSYKGVININDTTNLLNEQPAFSRTSQPATISLEHSTAIEAQKARLGDNATQAQLNVAYKLADSSIKLQELDAGTAQQRTTYVENGVEYNRTT